MDTGRDDDDDSDDNDHSDIVDYGGREDLKSRKGDYAGPKWGWHAHRIRLPDFFDYTCKGDPPLNSPSSSSSSSSLSSHQPSRSRSRSKSKKKKRRKVISLEDPSKQRDYESELWNLFKSVPVESEIEQDYTGDGGGVSSSSLACCQHTLGVKREIEEGLVGYTRLDCHSLSRLRKRDRHHLPRPLFDREKHLRDDNNDDDSNENDDARTSNGNVDTNPYQIDEPTVRVECWTQQLTRGSVCDSNKCEFEFLGSQTLLDMHTTIVHSGNDALFQQGMTQNVSRNLSSSGGRDEGSDDDNNEDGIVVDTTEEGKLSIPAPSGLFFIEDTFYITGDVDYATPILKWLDGNIRLAKNDEVLVEKAKFMAQQKADKKEARRAKKNNKKTSRQDNNTAKTKKTMKAGIKKPFRNSTTRLIPRSRREYLGISKDADLKIVSMNDAKLSSLAIRLGIRYFHTYNGDCESAVFFTDVAMRMQDESTNQTTTMATAIPTLHYPLVHDVWTTRTSTTAGYSNVCKACTRCPPVVFTLEDEMADGGPTFLCATCFAKLHYTKDGSKLEYNNFKVFPIIALKKLRDLSVGDLKENLTIF